MNYDILDFDRALKFRGWNGERWTREYTLNEMLVQQLEHNGLKEKWVQFIGFNDDNNKEIFEGDICKYTTNEKIGLDLKVFKGFIRFNDGRFEVGFHNGYGGEWQGLSYLLGNYSKGATSFKVVGNVFNLTK